MSSLNEAFIKAYGRESTNTPNASPPAPTAAAPGASQTLENWYSASTWYRVETAALSPVAAPHQPVAAVYQPPTASELSDLWVPLSGPTESDYRLSPVEPVPPPEVVIEEEAIVAPSPVPASAPVAPAAPKVTATSPSLVTPDFDRLFAPMQITTGWESSLMTLPPISTAGPVPVVTPAAPTSAPAPAKAALIDVKPAPPAAVAERPAAIVTPPAPAAKLVVTETVTVEKPPVEPKPIVIEKSVAATPPDLSPRLDTADSAPVPKPHVNFTSKAVVPPVPSAPVQEALKVAEPALKPAAPPAPIAAPVVAPMGLVQPAWEVDRFQWPDHCKQLLTTENEYLTDVGVRLSNAARDGLNILAVTSTRRGEGRTTLALCLARAAAQAGVKVALVDADIENAQLVNELGVEAACGWHEVVLGKQPLAEAAIVSLEDKFAFFPWTDSTGLKSLNDPRATRVLREIAKAYSLVILDLGPVPGRETRLFEDGDSCPVDAAILVRDVRWTSAIEAQRVASQLTAAGVESVGIAENFGPRAQQAA